MNIYPVEIYPEEPDCRQKLILMSGEDVMDVAVRLSKVIADHLEDGRAIELRYHNDDILIRTKYPDEEDWWWVPVACVHELVETDEEEIRKAVEVI